MTTFSSTSTGQNGTLQTFTVPDTGNYSIEAWGAQGGTATGSASGGLGARMYGEFSLVAGQTVTILVGQQGIGGNNSQNSHYSGGGGGGTFVTVSPHNTTASICVVAGGGGGGYKYYSSQSSGIGGTTAQTGTSGQGSQSGGGGGSGGNASNGGSSAGFQGNGLVAPAASAYVNGGAGGLMRTAWGAMGLVGGYGGGGGAGLPSGGGGGYSGGGGGTWSSSGAGGGGGSYNNGVNQSNTSAVRSGHGLVEILALNAPPTPPTLLTPADNATVALTSGVDFTYTHNDPDGDAQTGYALKRRAVTLAAGLIYAAEEWWNGTTWVFTTTTVASTSQPISATGWPAIGDTYQYALATSDASGLGAYSDWRTVNPYEWWNGTAWAPMVEGWIVSATSEATLSTTEAALVKGVSYNWTVATKDTMFAAPYAALFTFTAGGSPAHIWDGTAWVDHEVLIRDASSWVPHVTRIWDGTAWLDY